MVFAHTAESNPAPPPEPDQDERITAFTITPNKTGLNQTATYAVSLTLNTAVNPDPGPGPGGVNTNLSVNQQGPCEGENNISIKNGEDCAPDFSNASINGIAATKDQAPDCDTSSLNFRFDNALPSGTTTFNSTGVQNPHRG